MHYPFSRDVKPAIKKTPFETRTFGDKFFTAMTTSIDKDTDISMNRSMNSKHELQIEAE